MQNMSREELLSLLDDIRDRVATGDSFEGHIRYLIAEPGSQHPFDVAALYRIGNSMGQGGARIIGDQTMYADGAA
ncbi:hypothetical protein [Streptomyces sp. NPDC015131]|uniref:hypothetical protein n=1 Tax=Streptomyces sp. NPDC015131 TaxID=3364941 RepID=UPI0036FF6295